MKMKQKFLKKKDWSSSIERAEGKREGAYGGSLWVDDDDDRQNELFDRRKQLTT